MPAPQGQVYTRPTTEYQLFPEEYFASADCKVYFGDVWMDDLTGLSFKLFEKTQPVHGYASKTWDYFLRGKRFVQGYFKVAFREAGYLYTIMDHVGQVSGNYPASPAISYIMAGKDIPKWHGNVQDRLETLLSRWGDAKDLPDTTPRTETRYVDPWPEDFLKLGMTGLSIRTLQQNLTYENYYTGPINGVFDKPTEDAVKKKQQSRGEPVSGVVGGSIKHDYARKETVSLPGKALAKDANGYGEPRMVQYEQDIWGRSFVQEAGDYRKHESFFYRSRQSDVNGVHTQPLYQTGIDIYINYGPLPEFLKSTGNKPTEAASFNTTVKAIRNMQITNVQQTIDPQTGELIEEVYEFIAQDLD